VAAVLASVLGTDVDRASLAVLVEALKQKQFVYHQGAVAALLRIGSEGKGATDPLEKALGDTKEERKVRGLAAIFLCRIDPDRARGDRATVPALIAAQEEADAGMRRVALQYLTALKPADDAVAAELAKALKGDPDPMVRLQAATGLAQMEPSAARVAISALIERLGEGEGDASVRQMSAVALARLGAEAKDAVGPLAERLDKDPADVVKQQATIALGMIGSSAKLAVGILKRALGGQSSPELRQRVAEALGRIGPEAREAVPALVALLQSQAEAKVRARAAAALGDIRLGADLSVPALVKVLQDNQGEVVKAAAYALVKTGSRNREAIQGMVRLAKSTDPELRLYAVTSLGQAEAEDSEAVGTLVRAAADADARVRKQAVQALGVLHPETGEVITALVGALDKDDSDTRAGAGKALALIAETARDSASVPALRRASEALVHRAKLSDGELSAGLQRNKKTVDEAVKRLDRALVPPWVITVLASTVVVHILFWVGLLFYYQRSPLIQSLILWHPWWRRLLTLGYVQLILVGVGPIRRLLFRPFRDVLLADARLQQEDELTAGAYFPDLEVKPVAAAEGSSHPLRATDALGDLRGRFVLEGNSGQGKTMLLRWLVKNRQSRTSVFLGPDTVERFQGNVLAAIQSKLAVPGDQDQAFLRQLIRSNSIDIFIDGLNEVTPKSRDAVRSFVEDVGPVGVVLASQPIG
jgi:HEAT repeat protein